MWTHAGKSMFKLICMLLNVYLAVEIQQSLAWNVPLTVCLVMRYSTVLGHRLTPAQGGAVPPTSFPQDGWLLLLVWEELQLKSATQGVLTRWQQLVFPSCPMHGTCLVQAAQFLPRAHCGFP